MEAYLQGLVRGFLSAGDEVHIHTYKVDPSFAAGFTCQVHKKSFFYLPRRWKKYLFLKSCNEQFKRKNYDLSITLTRTFSPDIAIVGGVHPASMDADSGRRHVLKRFHDSMEIKYEKAMFNRVPSIVAHSKAIAEDIKKYYPDVDSEKISVIYPPVDTEFFSPIEPQDAKQIISEYQMETEKMTLLFPSTGHKRKGLAELLKAFRQLDKQRFELLITGEGLQHFSGIPDNVRYLGYIDNLSKLYSVVDYTILPSHYEPFGLAVVESLECGTPVIVTRNVGASDLLSDDEAIILDKNNPETIVHALLTLDNKSVEPGFVQRKGLSLANHIQRLKKLVQQVNTVKG